MAEFQITSWRELPSLVIARNGEESAKVQLASRFQEAIDEAAMRLGETSSDDYMTGWERGSWAEGEGEPAELAAAVAARLEETWTAAAIDEFLNALGPPTNPN